MATGTKLNAIVIVKQLVFYSMNIDDGYSGWPQESHYRFQMIKNRIKSMRKPADDINQSINQ